MDSKKLKVLVIDDEPIVADSLAQILNLFGYEAAPAYNPTTALEWVSTQSCDLLISDVVMDGHMSGIDLAIELSKLLPNCKILLMSGNNSTADLLRDAQANGHEFDVLAKPVHPSVVLERLKTLTEQSGRG